MWRILYTLKTSYGGCSYHIAIGSLDKGRGHSLHEELLQRPPPAWGPLFSNDQLVKGTQGVFTVTVVQKQCGVFCAQDNLWWVFVPYSDWLRPRRQPNWESMFSFPRRTTTGKGSFAPQQLQPTLLL